MLKETYPPLNSDGFFSQYLHSLHCYSNRRLALRATQRICVCCMLRMRASPADWGVRPEAFGETPDRSQTCVVKGVCTMLLWNEITYAEMRNEAPVWRIWHLWWLNSLSCPFLLSQWWTKFGCHYFVWATNLCRSTLVFFMLNCLSVFTCAKRNQKFKWVKCLLSVKDFSFLLCRPVLCVGETPSLPSCWCFCSCGQTSTPNHT